MLFTKKLCVSWNSLLVHLLVFAAIIAEIQENLHLKNSAVCSRSSVFHVQKLRSTDSSIDRFIPKWDEDGKRREAAWNREAMGLR
jgi:hypothetical protein